MITVDPAHIRRLAACTLVRGLTDWLIYTGHRKRRSGDPAPPWAQPCLSSLPAVKARIRRQAIAKLVGWLTTPQWAHEALDVDPRHLADVMGDPERVRQMMAALERHGKTGGKGAATPAAED